MSLLSAVRPRVRVAPQAPGNDAEDASFLASSYGLSPDPWQEDVLFDWLGRRRNARWASATCGLAVPRQNGKNGALEIRELFGMVALGEKFLHTAHEVKTARKAFLRIASFFENERQYPELAALVKDIRKTNGQEAVILSNGGSVEFIARSRGSGRGFTVDVLVCDEAQDLTDEELAALLPTISAAPTGNPQVILTGTPPDPEKLNQGEVFRRVRADGEARRDRRLAWTDFGVADGPVPDVNDRELWQQVNPALGIRLNVAEVERERGLMSPETFARERLGWWGDPATENRSTIDPTAWKKCLDPASTYSGNGHIALGVHISGDRATAYIVAVGERADGLAHVEMYEPIATSRAAGFIRAKTEQHGCHVVLDGSSHANSLVPALDQERVRVDAVSLQKYAQACGMVLDSVTNQAVRHIGQAPLDAAAKAAGVKESGRDAWIWDGTGLAPLKAMTLALWGYAHDTSSGGWAVAL